MVIYAPYGAYLPGGSLWHSQANEAALAHYPGLSVVIPSTPEDAAGLLWTAMHCEDPVLFLIPKHMFRAGRESAGTIRAIPLGKARKRQAGSDVTLIAWGNTVEKAVEAIQQIENEANIELIDLRSISPWDRETIEESVRKTGRVVVVQEDTENCSVGQMVITHLTSQTDLWNSMLGPPILVSKGNVMIGYNPIYEYAALPDVERIVAAIRKSVSTKQRHTVAAAVPAAQPVDRGRLESKPTQPRPATAATNIQSITVPIMGEGIRSAKVVALLKKPGDPIELDDALCEVETDKAVYPIESSFAGTMGEWKVEVGATVEIGQELGTILTESADQVEATPREPVAAVASRGLTPEKPRPATAATTRDPALSPTITRKLSRVIPANLQIDARWDAIRKARDVAKKKNDRNAPSPSVMMAWAVVRAMEKHAPFRRLVLEDETIVENENFDLGIAVAIEGDRLATAVITEANRKSWD